MSESMPRNATLIPPVQPLIIDMSKAKYILFINQTLLCSLFCFFELGSDLLSIIVFIKQGLHSSTNISLVALSLFDFIKCFFYLCMNLSVLNVVFSLYHVFPIFDAYYLVAAWPTALTVRISLFIMAFITIERYLSVSAPLIVKKLITHQRTVATLIAIVILNTCSVIPIYLSSTLELKYYPKLNVSLYSVILASNRQELEDISFGIHAILQLFSLCLITLFNFLLIVQLKRQSNWRLTKTSAVSLKKNTLANRDAKAKKMIITLAALSSICYLPSVTIGITVDFIKEFRIYGAYGPLINIFFSFCFLLGSINSASKFFIFYTMSSKFRVTLKKLFRKTFILPSS
ncbi:growth hormone secretagogue receptor type 1 [Biomphalaria glabrata]|nr:growth hormone secretagogue receptor type 1 [Biomphalaria glabrata]